MNTHMFLTRTMLIWGLTGWLVTAQAIPISNMVNQVTTQSYSNHLASLYTHDGESRGFTNGPSPRVPLLQHDLARDYLVSNFTAWGYDTWLDPFSFEHGGYSYTGANNVVAVKPGFGGTNVYVIGAHYDSVDAGHIDEVTLCPGADDNASGTAALLEIARVIKDYAFRDTIVIIAFDAEEKDYKGSEFFVANHITEDSSATNATTFLQSSILAMVNLDTIAYDNTNTPWRVVIGTPDGFNPVSFAMEQAVTNYTSLIPVHLSGYTLSDHRSFANAGIATVHLIEYDYHAYESLPDAVTNPHNHSDGDSLDTPGYISVDYAAEIAKCVVGAIFDNAGFMPPDNVTQTVSNEMVTFDWIGFPDALYRLYGAGDLSPTNEWTPIDSVTTNRPAAFRVAQDLETSPHRVFKVTRE